MKKYFILFLIVPFLAFKSSKKQENKNHKNSKSEIILDEYPEALQKVFKAHGSLALWNKQKTLTFTLPKPKNPETFTVDLKNRNELIATPTFTLGYDGKPWVLDEKKEYKGNPEFYHNLMFYFYAMPFVVGDKGIIYSETEDLVFEGKSYPGIKISYNDGVGTSPKDNYFLHYDPKTYQMQWLGYTVTYRSGKKSDDVKWIRYNDWTTHNGLALPNSLSWYKVKDNKITELRNKVVFENVSLSEESKTDTFFTKPETATYFSESK